MGYYRLMLAGLFSVLMVFGAFAQDKETTAQKVTGLTLDGNLDEGFWSTGAKESIVPDFLTIDVGSADDENDCSADFVMVWDNVGVYCGSWFHDDIHNVTKSNSEATANYAWMDDGHEWWINGDFDDFWNDGEAPYFGDNGWQMSKGWNFSGGQAQNLYAAYFKDFGTGETKAKSATMDYMRGEGFDCQYTSDDGVNFTIETQWKWAGNFMANMGTPTTGKELAFNLGVNDNDGSASFDCAMRWTGMDHNDFQGWGKVTLADGSGISPKARVVLMPENQKIAGVYDILGRKIQRVSGGRTGVYFKMLKNSDRSNIEKSIYLR